MSGDAGCGAMASWPAMLVASRAPLMAPSAMSARRNAVAGSACPRRGGSGGGEEAKGCWTRASLSMPPRPPIAAAPGARVGVLRFDQAQADESPLLIHSLDRVTVQLQLADHGRWGIKPSRAQRGKRHRLLTSTTQLLKRQTMLPLNERNRTELSTLRPRRSRLHALLPFSVSAASLAPSRTFWSASTAWIGSTFVALTAASEGTFDRQSHDPAVERHSRPYTTGRHGTRHRIGRCRCDTGWADCQIRQPSPRDSRHAPGWRQSSAGRTYPPVVRPSATQVAFARHP
jgi:hypothetical protein